MNNHSSRQQSMNHNRRNFNQQNNVTAQFLAMPYTHGVNCGNNGIEAAAKVWGILWIHEGIYGRDVDSDKVSQGVYDRFRDLMSGIKKWWYDHPEIINLFENWRVQYDAVDSSFSSYIRVIPSKSWKTLQVTYMTHTYNPKIDNFEWSSPKSFPIDTPWEEIVTSLGNEVNAGDRTFENYQPD